MFQDEEEDPRDNYRALLPRRRARRPERGWAVPEAPVDWVVLALMALMGLALALAFWGPVADVLWPLCAIVPPTIVLFAWMSGGRVRLGGGGPRRDGSGGTAAVVGVAALVAGAFFQFTTMIWDRALLVVLAASIVAAIPLGRLITRLEPKDLGDEAMVGFVILLVALWLGALSVEVNSVLPLRSTRVAPVRVTDKEEHHHKSDYYRLWFVRGPEDYAAHMDVDGGFYRQVGIGEQLCLYEIKGQLRMRWRTLDRCPVILK